MTNITHKIRLLNNYDRWMVAVKPSKYVSDVRGVFWVFDNKGRFLRTYGSGFSLTDVSNTLYEKNFVITTEATHHTPTSSYISTRRFNITDNGVITFTQTERGI